MAKQKPQTEENQAHQDNGFETVNESGYEGSVLIFDEQGQNITGIFLGLGREIGKGQMKNSTYKLHDLETGSLMLIPFTSVLQSKIEDMAGRLVERQLNGNHVTIKVSYQGKKSSSGNSGNSYHDWNLAFRVSTQEEIETLEEGNREPIIDFGEFV